MTTKEGSTKILNFMTPGIGVPLLRQGHISHTLKMDYSLITSSLLPSRQTKYKVMTVKEGLPKIVNVMTPGAGIRVLRPYSS